MSKNVSKIHSETSELGKNTQNPLDEKYVFFNLRYLIHFIHRLCNTHIKC